MEKIKALWNVMRLGQQVADPELWDKRQDFGNMIGGLILAIVVVLKVMFEVDLSEYINEELALLIGGVIATTWNLVLTRARKADMGVLPPKPAAPVPAPNPADDPYRY